MTSCRTILDSSPVPIPPVRTLKRSASIASLPTPPRTHRRRTSLHSSHRTDSGSSDDGNSDESGDGREPDEGRLVLGNKKCKMSPLLFRVPPREPVSPPPSRRQSKSQPQSQNLSPPVTPKRQPRTKGHYPVRDSPNNPFLVDTPLPGSPSDILELESLDTPSPADFAEKPTITYVFRGVKAEFANPLYKPASSSTKEPTTPPRHTLPLSDPDYSPDLRCPPKLLFKAARRLQGKRAAIKKRLKDAVSERDTKSEVGLVGLPVAQELAVKDGETGL